MKLQWVHGPQTVVMAIAKAKRAGCYEASMGPRSSDRGYEDTDGIDLEARQGFNGSTVLRPWLWPTPRLAPDNRSAASMGPRSSDRGYAVEDFLHVGQE